MHEPSVDVILPIYGQHRVATLDIVIQSLQRQSGVSLSVIVACANDNTQAIQLCDRYGLQCARVHPRDAVVGGRFVPAAFRNTAIAHSQSELLYNSDADIVYLSSRFFTDLIDWSTRHSLQCVFAPPMRRMPLDVVPRFIDLASNCSLECALGGLILNRPFLATLDAASHQTVVFRDNKKRGLIRREPQDARWLADNEEPNGSDRLIVYLESDYSDYRSSTANKGTEPFFCTQDVHCGGTLVSRGAVHDVGGFCMDYLGWGCHDVDLQAKLRTVCRCSRIPRSSRFCVLHLDHERAYFDKSQWRANRHLLATRTSSIETAITLDRKVLTRLVSDQRCEGRSPTRA